MKSRTVTTYFRIGSLFSILALLVAVSACRTVEPESPEIEEEESFDEPVAADTDDGDSDTEWEDLDDQDDQNVSDLDSPDDSSSAGGGAPIKTTHKVKPGESLWDISNKYYDRGVYWRAIRDHNNMESGQINAGETLEIPELTSQRKEQLRSMAADKSGGSSTGGSTPTGPGTYVTKEGDTFWKIAQREYGNGEQWKRIWRANKSKVPNPDDLKAGIKIRIPGKGSGSSGKGSGSPQKGQKGGTK